MARLQDDDLEDDDAGAEPANGDAPRKKFKFHRGDIINHNPNRADYQSKTFLQDYLLKGWLPHEPFLTRGTKVTAFGSCFAANITRHLTAIGYDLSSKRDPDLYVSRLADGLVNTASILGQLEWALENKQPTEALWHGFDAERFGYVEDIRLRTRDVFLSTGFFIITLGLSEIWYDEKTGGTFWRAVPERHFDASRHKFRVLSMEETKADIAKMHRLVREYVPKAKILFTVSPIPLTATFRPVGCLTANMVSKAIIRAALDEFLRGHLDELNKELFYFPSMEIVQLGFTDPLVHGGRHPASYVLDTVMKTFEAAYCVGEATFEDANAMFQMFRAKNVRDIAQREPQPADDASEHVVAKTATREGKAARKQARAQEHTLHRSVRAPARAQRAEGARGTGDGKERKPTGAARRAARIARRKARGKSPPDPEK